MKALKDGVYVLQVAGDRQEGLAIPSEIWEQEQINHVTRRRRELQEQHRRENELIREHRRNMKTVLQALKLAGLSLAAFGCQVTGLASAWVTAPIIMIAFGGICFTAGRWMTEHKK